MRRNDDPPVLKGVSAAPKSRANVQQLRLLWVRSTNNAIQCCTALSDNATIVFKLYIFNWIFANRRRHLEMKTSAWNYKMSNVRCKEVQTTLSDIVSLYGNNTPSNQTVILSPSESSQQTTPIASEKAIQLILLLPTAIMPQLHRHPGKNRLTLFVFFNQHHY